MRKNLLTWLCLYAIIWSQSVFYLKDLAAILGLVNTVVLLWLASKLLLLPDDYDATFSVCNVVLREEFSCYVIAVKQRFVVHVLGQSSLGLWTRSFYLAVTVLLRFLF